MPFGVLSHFGMCVCVRSVHEGYVQHYCGSESDCCSKGFSVTLSSSLPPHSHFLFFSPHHFPTYLLYVTSLFSFCITLAVFLCANEPIHMYFLLSPFFIHERRHAIDGLAFCFMQLLHASSKRSSSFLSFFSFMLRH